MTSTPRTDAVLLRLVNESYGNSADAVVIHHARQLERELAAKDAELLQSRAQVARLREGIDNFAAVLENDK